MQHSLPILDHKSEIQELLEQHQVLIIAGETGSGKTTQLPQFCLEAGRGSKQRIACTQPRRVAATSIAQRVSEEMQTDLGTQVGYKIRFAEKLSEETSILFMTDGILLAEIQSDPMLKAYDTIILDEAHERTLNIDFLIGYLMQLLKKRRDLKVLITSANLDIERFAKMFDNAPILEVSGRMYPVEVEYRPLDEEHPKPGVETMEDHVVSTLRDLLQNTWDGNILVFLPGEREIREVLERVSSSPTKHPVDCLPLYGRLSNKDQNRIFQESSKRKIIIATNIAETSLTIPGIRYVVDSGQARMLRFQSRTRTQQLQVEPISQSSANQRKGRAGRVESGICIRLYSEESLEQRKPFTDPEILRSSLASVLLRMLHLRLGDIESFPLMDRPSKQAIAEGFKELKELGAIDYKKKLTKLGKKMVRFPIEPRMARILLAAKYNHAVQEGLILVAGLSTQDPREMPRDQESQAKQAHKVFANADSDFVTLLNIWNAYQEHWIEHKTQNKMRQFCKKNFLSYLRMREWLDVYQQLKELLQEQGKVWINKEPASNQAIHQTLLSGYLNQIGQKTEKSAYRTSGSREMLIFPGSGVYQKGKAWVMAAVLMETSKLYARMVANIEVEWVEPVARRQCRYQYAFARFDEKSQRVVANEKVTLHGLTLVPQKVVSYGKVNPKEATALFIQEALVDGKLRSHHEFYQHNQALQEQVRQMGAKLRRSYDYEVEQAAQAFYEKRLYNIFSEHDLNRLVKEWRSQGKLDELLMHESDLLPEDLEQPDVSQYPDSWEFGNEALPIDYVLPDAECPEGVVVRLTPAMVPHVNGHTLEWLVPGHHEEKIVCLLKGLPKSVRKQFIPVGETAKQLAQVIDSNQGTFVEALSVAIRQQYRLSVSPEEWDLSRVPAACQIRLKIEDDTGEIYAEGSDIPHVLSKAQKRLAANPSASQGTAKLEDWETAAEQWFLSDIQSWSFETLPQQIIIAEANGVPLYGYPGLRKNEEGIQRCLFEKAEEAKAETQQALRRLLAFAAGPDMAWFEKDIKGLKTFKSAYKPFGTWEDLQQAARICIEQYLFDGPWVENEAQFNERVSEVQEKLKTVWSDFRKHLNAILEEYQQLQKEMFMKLSAPSRESQYTMIQKHFQMTLPSNFVEQTPFEQFKHLPRYLKALSLRIERLLYDSQKDLQKAEQLAPYLEHHELWERDAKWRQMLEEFKVSLFAPELKTAIPVSAKRLDSFCG